MLHPIFKKLMDRGLTRTAVKPNTALLSSDSLELKVIRSQSGSDEELRNTLISDYKPFVARVASKLCKRYIDPASDEEFSIALIALNEAIDQFTLDKGSSFLVFAETVIRRRIIDHIRKEQKFKQQIPLSSFEIVDEEGNTLIPLETDQAVDHFEQEKIAEERKHEISELTQSLAQFGISFAQLAEISPKHHDSRVSLMEIGKIIAGNDELMSIVFVKKTLPIKELLQIVDVSRKTLERHRKFLICIAVIYQGPFDYLKDYLHTAESNVKGVE